ncbi:hypothetical protein NN561_007196 [Cricetulus griseus]
MHRSRQWLRYDYHFGMIRLCVSNMEADLSGFNIDAPRWDQSTFLGRVKHFFNITDPRTVFASEQELDWAKVMVEKSRMGLVPPGTQVEQLLYAKKLYDSAFHPDTGEKMNVIGRMSFQVPGGMIITGFMLQFYRLSVHERKADPMAKDEPSLGEGKGKSSKTMTQFRLDYGSVEDIEKRK